MRIVLPIDVDQTSICPVLGRCPYFLIMDTETQKRTLKTNPAADAQEGAGLKAAQFIVDCDADTLITPRCGANSAEVFQLAEIRIFQSAGTDAEENIRALLDDKLPVLNNFHSGYHGIR